MTRTPLFQKSRLDSKLAVLFVLIGLAPLFIGGSLALIYATDILHRQVMDKLQVVAESKAQRIEGYVLMQESDAMVHTFSPTVQSHLGILSATFHQQGPYSPEYAAAAMNARAYLTRYMQQDNYDNVLLIDAAGVIVFSVVPTAEFGSNLRTAPYQDSALAKVFDNVGTLLASETSDYERDAASGEQKAFVAAPIFKNGVLIGALAFRINNREMFAIARDYTGLGDTGETLIGRRESDTILLMVPTRYEPQAAFRKRIALRSRTSFPLQEATRGNNGIGQARDYRGVEVLATWKYLPSLRCGLVVKIDTTEAFAPIRTLRRAAMGFGILVALLVALMAPLISRHLAAPLRNLSEAARAISAGDLTHRTRINSTDEVGDLAAAFNQMADTIQHQITALSHARQELEMRVQKRTADLAKSNQDLEAEISERKGAQAELENIHKQLMVASRRGGMAEIATNVLHNVGNVLNSVSVSASLVVGSVKKSKAASLAKVVGLLREHEQDLGTFITSDPKGKQLPVYLGQLSDHLLADQDAIVQELELLRGNVEHIKEIVAMQQSYATFGGVKEMIDVVNLVEDSMRMNEDALNRHHVKVVREFGTVAPLNLDKHKILQILVNLVRNAKHACQDSDRSDKQLTVRVGNGDGRVRISVIDNGVGIPAENLTRIFSHGFTTRKDGHGFGLHSGALAAKEMGGSLTVQSEGAGRGATFTLELPLEQKANAA